MKPFIAAAIALLAFVTVSRAADNAAAPAPTNRPNILVIVSDDQGYADAGFQGSKDIVTPNLDRLAASGLHCTNGYVTHPYCSPSRAGLLTGRYQGRFGHERNPRYLPESHEEGLPLTETLFPSLLANSGYTTGWIGKWHLGAAPEFHPGKRGFTETFGFIGGGHHYQDWKVKPGTEYNVPILRNGKPVEVKQHLTLTFGHEAADFVTRHKDQPWFLYLAFNAPHTPHEPTAERLAKFANIKDKKRREYAAQISLLDDAVGETLAALHASGQDQRTLIFFFSDNGGPEGPPSNFPLRGHKGEVYEGGMHVPFLISWPGHIPAGKDYTPAVSSLDVAATALALAGVAAPTDKPLDGVNLIPFLTGENSASPHDKLFWRESHSLSAALRAGDSKFVRHGEKPAELYDLKNDLGEKTDLSTADPKKVAALQADVDAWMKPLPKHLAFLGLGGSADKPWPDDAGKEP